MSGGSIFLHGIYQRSGTNHLLHLLSKHPGVEVFPKGIWEFPFLHLADDLIAFDRCFADHSKVTEMKRGELLPFFGESVLRAIEHDADVARLILKYPSVENLSSFFDFFPEQKLLIVVRDGRDVAASALKTRFARPKRARLFYPGTWRFLPGRPHVVLARRWKIASREIRDFLALMVHSPRAAQITVVRFEDLVADRRRVLASVLERLGLEPAAYPWMELENEPVRGSSFLNRGPRGKLDWKPVKNKSESFSPVGRWQGWKSDTQSRYLNVAGDELAAWGYGDRLEEPEASLLQWVVSVG